MNNKLRMKINEQQTQVDRNCNVAFSIEPFIDNSTPFDCCSLILTIKESSIGIPLEYLLALEPL